MLVHSAHPHSRCPLVPVRRPSLLLALVSAHPLLLPLAPLVVYMLLLVLGYIRPPTLALADSLVHVRPPLFLSVVSVTIYLASI